MVMRREVRSGGEDDDVRTNRRIFVAAVFSFVQDNFAQNCGRKFLCRAPLCTRGM